MKEKPEIKARALVLSYQLIVGDFQTAIKCALICVDEILNSNPIIPLQYMLESESLDAAREYWQEVKQIIKNL